MDYLDELDSISSDEEKKKPDKSESGKSISENSSTSKNDVVMKPDPVIILTKK